MHTFVNVKNCLVLHLKCSIVSVKWNITVRIEEYIFKKSERHRENCVLAILCNIKALLGKAWHSSKLIFLEMGSNNVIEGEESENQGPKARMRVVYVTANDVLKSSKNVKKHLNG